jgi:threonine aldolase
MLLGSADFIKEARIWRKRLGGGMRQIGILAAADIDGISLDVGRVVTNIVIFDTSRTGLSSAEIVSQLRDAGILAIGFGNLIRMVTHFDVSASSVDQTVKALRKIVTKAG